MTDTPNLDRMLQVRDDGRAEEIQQFLDWFCDVYRHDTRSRDLDENTYEGHREEIMAAYFGVDLAEMERERMALLNDLRERSRQTQIIRRRKAKASR